MNTSFMRVHPLIAAAAASVIVVSLVGTAAIMDWLPGSKGQSPEVSNQVMPAAPSTAPVTSNATPPTQAAPRAVKPMRSTPSQPSYPAAQKNAPTPIVAQAPAVCEVCGKVEAVRTVEVTAKPSGVGVVAGAVVGGLLGNQVGGGSGKTLATVAGAVGGGYAGNEIEKRTRKSNAYEVDVRLDNGQRRSFRYETEPNWRAGDRIKVVNDTLAAP